MADSARMEREGERVAILEFELRKAKETIQGLRATLTQATGDRRGGEGEREREIYY